MFARALRQPVYSRRSMGGRLLALALTALTFTLSATFLRPTKAGTGIASPLWTGRSAPPTEQTSGSITVKRLALGQEFLPVASWRFLVGCVPLLLGTLIEYPSTIIWTSRFVGVLRFLALMGTALASAVCFWQVQADDPGRTILLPMPIRGFVLATNVKRETVTLAEATGLGLTIVVFAIAAAKPLRRLCDHAPSSVPVVPAEPNIRLRRITRD